MTGSLPDTLLVRLSAFLAAEMGLYFPPERWRDLERGIASARREFNFADEESCIRWLTSSPLTQNQVEVLAGHLTVGETYFFRHKQSFDVLRDHILPELIAARRGKEQRLRIWSAGCCTGEEPYSLAILLRQMLPDWEEWNITILATDINPRSLEKASRGEYNQWSFREPGVAIQDRYFTRSARGRFELHEDIREMVVFSYLNLAQDAYPSLVNGTNAMDVIFCRNVLMYFAPERAREVVGGLHRALVQGGWLIVSPSEIAQGLFSQFSTVHFPGAVAYKKDLGGPLPPTMFPCEPMAEAETFLEPLLDPGAHTGAPLHGLSTEFQSLPEESPASYEEAQTLYATGRYAEAAEVLARLMSGNPEEAAAMALLARVYANQGRLSEALACCERALDSEKLSPAFHYLRSSILEEQGLLEEAAASLKRALYLDQNFALAHFALGNIRRRQGRRRESAKHFENALLLAEACRQEEPLPESEGLTAARLIEIIGSTCPGEAVVER